MRTRPGNEFRRDVCRAPQLIYFLDKGRREAVFAGRKEVQFFIAALPLLGTKLFTSVRISFWRVSLVQHNIRFQPSWRTQNGLCRGCLLGYTLARFFHNVLHYLLQIARFLEYAQLPFGAGALSQNPVKSVQALRGFPDRPRHRM